ncbi:MAG: NADH-quinone oxidoreductase subunit N [Bacteroidia bacterium]
MEQSFIQQLLLDSGHTTPLAFLLVLGLLLMLMDVFDAKKAMPWLTGIGLLMSALLALQPQLFGDGMLPEQSAFKGMIKVGGIAQMTHVLLCLSGFFVLFFIQDFLKRQAKPVYEVYALLVFSIIGMIMMANAGDLLMTFVGLETFSIPLYIFAALFKTEKRSNEAGLKYFLLGAFASAFMLFGISILYGMSGTTKLAELTAKAEIFAANPPLFMTGVAMLLVGFLFKVSAFPFHSWTPDVYEGTPTPLAGFMATGSKMAVFISMAQVMASLNYTGYGKIIVLIATAALLSMVWGNIVAARQKNIKRMLAYSSIAHTGYVLLGMCAGKAGLPAVIFYMFIYTLMNVGAFGLVGMAEEQHSDTNMDNWRGLGLKSPLFGAIMSIFLFSMAGIPPLAGFMSKYYVFYYALKAQGIPMIIPVLGILTSVVAAYYYIYVIVIMYFGKEEQPTVRPAFDTLPVAGVILLAVLVVILGLAPSLMINPINDSFKIAAASVAGLF